MSTGKGLVLRDQPGYRIAYDAQSLTTRELLSLVIGGKNSEEVARSLLERFHGIRQLYQADIEEICSVLGVGRKTAEKIKAALHLGLRLNDPVEKRVYINSPDDAANLVRYEMSLLPVEYFRVILLDTRNGVIGMEDIYRGCLYSVATIREAEVFKPAITRMARSIILAHNHPSGEVLITTEDIECTRNLINVGRLMDIPIVDHIVIGSNNRFASIKRERPEIWIGENKSPTIK
jgi:DNA repair protein RadC